MTSPAPATRRRSRAARRGGRRRAGTSLALAVASGVLVGGLPGIAVAGVVPAYPANLPAGVEALQPYVGQTGCDPVAKPGVLAFQSLLMSTYRDTGTLGIVRDCGIGGQSEHKEGRALDWAVSAFNANQAAEVQSVTDWLTATVNGVPAANARRFGIMYMIWNHRIWGAYKLDQGWQPYTGPVPHTDHVHFSFGWNGAKKSTSWWTGQVAPIDYGPYAQGPPPAPTPEVDPANIVTLARYGGLVLSQGSTGEPVRVIQTALDTTADGDFGPNTAAKVREFQTGQGLGATGIFGPVEWARLFPRPVAPFGNVETVRTTATGTTISGWAVDADTTAPIAVHVYVDGRGYPILGNLERPDVAATFPGVGSAHGFSTTMAIGDGAHQLCVYAIDVGPGDNTVLQCSTIVVQHDPISSLEQDGPTPTGYRVAGWSFDPDAPTTASQVHVYVDGVGTVLTADGNRPDVGGVYPAAGARHGFAYDFGLADGRHSVCVYSINSYLGTTGTLDCRVVVVARSPLGSLDQATAVAGGIAASGWAFDPDVAQSPLAVHVYVDGTGVALTADQPRNDLAAAFPGAGSAHGWSLAVPAARGTHQVCAYGINTGPGTTTVLGCRKVTVG